MKKFLVFATVAFIAACSPTKEVVEIYKGDPGVPGQDGVSCTVSQLENGALLSCSDETVVTILNGQNGQNGSNGTDGQDGESCSVEQLENGAQITCAGSSATVLNGTDGEDGQDGSNGSNGTIVTIANYTSSSCTRITGTSTYIKVGNTNARLYSSSSCHSNSKFAEISQGESYWASGTALAVWYDDGVRVLIFNFVY